MMLIYTFFRLFSATKKFLKNNGPKVEDLFTEYFDDAFTGDGERVGRAVPVKRSNAPTASKKRQSVSKSLWLPSANQNQIKGAFGCHSN
jgi:hypothetical protein